MLEEKKRRLEAKGWKIGSAAEFLGLTPNEEAYIALRLQLADDMKKRRMRLHITQSDMAKVVHSSQSRIAKMEAGDPKVSLDLLIRGIFALGASPKDLARIISKTQTTR